MKKIFFILSLPLLFSCHKKSNSISTPIVKTYEQAWDSIGIQYEKKYWYQHNTVPPGEWDTIIFHSNKSITEIYPAALPSGSSASITYFPTHNEVYYQKEPKNIVVICIKFLPMNDTFTGLFPLHDHLTRDTAILSAAIPMLWSLEMPPENISFNFLTN